MYLCISCTFAFGVAILSRGGGGLLSPKSYIDFLYTNFLLDYPPIIPFSIEKHPILPRLGAFYINLLKYTQFLNLGSFVSDETHRSPYQISRESTPKGRHIYVIYSMWEPPGFWVGWNIVANFCVVNLVNYMKKKKKGKLIYVYCWAYH